MVSYLHTEMRIYSVSASIVSYLHTDMRICSISASIVSYLQPKMRICSVSASIVSHLRIFYIFEFLLPLLILNFNKKKFKKGFQ